MTSLFSNFSLKEIKLRNRIAVPPMCQYRAEDGIPNDWHLIHYTSLARGGAGLVVVEATAVSPEGRITPACLGIWNDKQKVEFAKIAKNIKTAGAVAGIQIAHAGRKGSSNLPWVKNYSHLDESDDQAWEPIAPSSIPFGDNLPRVPKEMTISEIERVKSDFVKAAESARDAGFEWLELHFAHGYLAQSFFSKHSNHRTDQYGGTFEGRSRFLLETLQAVRKVWPENLPLTIRFGVLEYDNHDEETLKESIDLIKKFKENGLDLLNLSIGFNIPDTNIPWGDGFLGDIALRVRNEVNIPIASAWGFAKAEVASDAIKNKKLDLVMIGRAMLANPHYPYTLAQQLKIDKASWVLPESYAHWLERYSI